MFDQAVQASDAMREAAHSARGRLLPALAICKSCNSARIIASPVLGRCIDCGAELDVRQSTESAPPNT